MEAARAGLGVALVPRYDLGDDVEAGRLLIPVDHACPTDRDYYFASPEPQNDETLVAAFRAWLLEQTAPWRSGTAVRR
jgi:DNA-binding transcriptional LysR family regulator